MGGFLKTLSIKVRRQETPAYAAMYRLAKRVNQLSFPTLGPLHRALYAEWDARTSLWHEFWRVVYYEPIFKSQCAEVGPRFRMLYAGNGCTKISGHVVLRFGSDVTIFDNTDFIGLKVFDNPELIVGDHSYLGPRVRFMISTRIKIGSHCLITARIITDNPGHRIADVMSRLESGGGSPAPEDCRPITIGDFCFIPLDCVVYPGVTVGDGVCARIGTHIAHDVPPFCQIGGNPARVIRKLPIPPEIESVVGRERYEGYLAAHAALETTKT